MRATVNTIDKLWNICSIEELEKNNSSLTYIKALAAMTNTSIARWNIISVFGNGSGANLVSDPNKINQLFFAKAANGAPDPAETQGKEQAFTFSVTAKARLQERLFATVNAAVFDCKRAVTRLQSEVIAHRKQLNTSLASLVKANAKLAQISSGNAINNKIDTIERDICSVLADGFWCDPIVERQDGSLWMRTVNDITLTEIKRSAGIAMVVNLGRFAVNIGFPEPFISVYPYKDNKCDDGYYHPHIDEEGNLCWGDASELADRYLTDGDLQKLLFLVKELITSYNPGNPYRDLGDLADADCYHYHSDDSTCPYRELDREEAKRNKEAKTEAACVPDRLDHLTHPQDSI